MTTVLPIGDRATDNTLTRDTCRSLLTDLHPGEEQWAYLERPNPEAEDPGLAVVLFASHADYKRKLQDCADANVAIDEQQVSTFIYRPAPEYRITPGQRRLFPNLPKASVGGHTGVVAVTLTTNRWGETVAKKLLFASNPAVGELAQSEIERWMEVKEAGNAGGFLDVLYFRFQGGELKMMLIKNFTASEP